MGGRGRWSRPGFHSYFQEHQPTSTGRRLPSVVGQGLTDRAAKSSAQGTSASQWRWFGVQADFARSMSMATQIVMDHTGDSRYQFDPGDVEAVARAERRFRKLTRAGFIAAERTAAGQSRRVKSFDASAEETIFFPRLVG